tara:strand:+ start:109 stop:315 length:207 start_codon:yes stop_codon:yes gene_type:complete
MKPRRRITTSWLGEEKEEKGKSQEESVRKHEEKEKKHEESVRRPKAVEKNAEKPERKIKPKNYYFNKY